MADIALARVVLARAADGFSNDAILAKHAPALATTVLELVDIINALEVTATGLHMDGRHQAKVRWGVRLTPEQWALIHACRPPAPQPSTD